MTDLMKREKRSRETFSDPNSVGWLPECIAKLELHLAAGRFYAAHSVIDYYQKPPDHESPLTGDSHIGELGLPLRVSNALVSAGFKKIAELFDGQERLQAIRGLGKQTIDSIYVKLAEVGLG